MTLEDTYDFWHDRITQSERVHYQIYHMPEPATEAAKATRDRRLAWLSARVRAARRGLDAVLELMRAREAWHEGCFTEDPTTWPDLPKGE